MIERTIATEGVFWEALVVLKGKQRVTRSTSGSRHSTSALCAKTILYGAYGYDFDKGYGHTRGGRALCALTVLYGAYGYDFDKGYGHTRGGGGDSRSVLMKIDEEVLTCFMFFF